jgi:hypothetical protein
VPMLRVEPGGVNASRVARLSTGALYGGTGGFAWSLRRWGCTPRMGAGFSCRRGSLSSCGAQCE